MNIAGIKKKFIITVLYIRTPANVIAKNPLKTNKMKNLETLIKNASRMMKISNKEWIAKGSNVDFKPKIIIYENGYMVGMYHPSASPQFTYTTKKVYGGKELGEYNFCCVFPHQVHNDKVEDIVNMVQLLKIP